MKSNLNNKEKKYDKIINSNAKKETQNHNKKTLMMQRYDNPSYVQIYDNRYRSLQYHKILLLIDNFLEQWTPSNSLGLDFGGGTGLLRDFLMEYLSSSEKSKNFRISLINIDVSFQMLLKSKNKQKLGIESKNKLKQSWISEKLQSKNSPFPQIPPMVCADGENLPFRSKQYDYVFALTSIQNLPNPIKGFQEIKRVCSEGGRFVFSYLKKKVTLADLENILSQVWHKESLPEKPGIKILDSRTDQEDWLGFVQQ